jgi:hypothetical protein
VIVVRLFGVEVLAFGREEEGGGPGDVTTYPVGFAPVRDTRYDVPPGGSVE